MEETIRQGEPPFSDPEPPWEKADILVSAGTGDARELVDDLLNRGYSVMATVVSDWGAELLERSRSDHGRLAVRVGRLDECGFFEGIRKCQVRALVDASHPYAEALHACLRGAAEKAGLPYFRLLRASSGDEADPDREPEAAFPITERPSFCGRYDVASAEEAAWLARKLLKEREPEARILLTTGAKDLALYSRILGGERLIARVLPLVSSLEACREAGISSDRILALQGPFSEALNRELIRASMARLMISKDGGSIGGFPEKVRAAAAEGIPIIVIQRPCEGQTDRVFTEARDLVDAVELVLNPPSDPAEQAEIGEAIADR